MVWGLFDNGFSNSWVITKLILKSLIIAVVVGGIFGLLNMYFERDDFKKKD